MLVKQTGFLKPQPKYNKNNIFVNISENTSFWYNNFVSPMAQTLQIIQIVSSLLLVILVLLQRSSGDMGSTLGSDGGSFMQTRRGAERLIFVLTIIVAIVFAGASLASLVLLR
jgi:protein translocase SecG subunit